MFYLRKEPHEAKFEKVVKTDGTVIPERVYMTDDIAIYKHRHYSRYYRQEFLGIDVNPPQLKLYTCKSLKRILELRKNTFDYCGQWFDVYDENGKVDIKE